MSLDNVLTHCLDNVFSTIALILLVKDLQETLDEVFMKSKSTGKELKKGKNENLQQLAKI